MKQTVRVEQFWVDRQKMIAHGRLSIGFGEWNVEMFAPLGLPHEDPEDASTWGPASPEHVDWAGLDANTNIRYQAWLGELLMGEGPTEEEAVEAAVAEYETSVGYGDAPHLYPDRETLVADLDVIGLVQRL